MPLISPKSLLVLMVFSLFLPMLSAQAPTSGEVTVQLQQGQGLNSAVNPKGVSQGRVVKTTNPAIPVGSTALVGLGSDPINGGYTAKLLQLTINGQTMRAASSAVVLAPNFLTKGIEFGRKGPKDSASGTSVFLPENVIVRFTLAEPPPPPVPHPPPPSPVRKAASPPPPPVTGKSGDFPAGPGLPVLHTDRDPYEGCRWSPLVSKRFGFAILVMNCSGPSSENMPKYTADDPTFINSYAEDRRLSAATPKTSHSATIEVFTKTAAQTLDAAVREQLLSTIRPRWRTACHVKLSGGNTPGNGMQMYDFTGTSALAIQFYKKSELGTELPCSPWEDTDSANNFYYNPAESKTTFFFSNTGQEAPNYDMASIRFLSSDGPSQGASPASAPSSGIVAASCPIRPGKMLVDINVRVLPGGRSIAGEGDEAGASFDLNSPPLKPGEHVELECMYAPPGSKSGTIPGRVISAANRQTVPVPAGATFCEFQHDPNRARCSQAAQ